MQPNATTLGIQGPTKLEVEETGPTWASEAWSRMGIHFVGTQSFLGLWEPALWCALEVELTG